MPRPEKVQAVAEIKERIEGAQAVFLAEYAGLSVKDQQSLRRQLRASGAEFKVVKMTLARRAADDLDLPSLEPLLWGPTGVTYADGDPVGVAKVLKDFAKDHSVFLVKGGLLGADFLSPERIEELAEIEPRDVLLARIAGAMKAPMANMAALLAALPRNTASVLQQLLDKKQAASPPEAESTPESASSSDDGSEAAGDAEDAPAEGADEADDAPEAKADTDAPGAEDAAPETEDDSEPTVEASTDADDETEDTADAASDAEEE
jgi:large subunit ribosomal protein L10